MGGSSSRFIGEDKCLYNLHGSPIFSHSLKTFVSCGIFSHYVIVYRDQQQLSAIKTYLASDSLILPIIGKIIFAEGGSERKFSVYNALCTIAQLLPHDSKRYVFVHDGARPFITKEKILELFEVVKSSGAAVLAHQIVDTVIRNNTRESSSPYRSNFNSNLEYIPRNNLWGIETPQAFLFEKLFEGYRQAIDSQLPITDDSGAYPGEISIVENSDDNSKITFREDVLKKSKLV